MAQVKFVSCTLAQYKALAERPASTLYFVSDERRLYKGETPFSGGIFKAVESYPTTGDINTIYANTLDGSVKFWNGNEFVTLVKPQPAAITGVGLATELATTKAVVDYVAAKVADLDVAAIEGRVKANEDAIAVINGEETVDGSIKKALADAKAAVSALENGQVATNKSDIAAIKTGKADKATTLAGYGISDAFTKDETTSAINSAVANAHHLKREVVDALPAVDDANADTIYMVPKKTGVAGNADGNTYVEYMLVNGKFEQIGDSTVDLTDYATKTYADGKANDAQKAAEAHADALVNALDVADNAVADQYVSAVSQENGLVTVSRATLPVRSVAASTTAGAIKVNGADVKVAGLGSAAFTESTAYATAAQGVKADTALQAADIAEGTVSGTVNVKGTDVKVHGLGGAAYKAEDYYALAGAPKAAADAALKEAKQYVDDSLTWEEL